MALAVAVAIPWTSEQVHQTALRENTFLPQCLFHQNEIYLSSLLFPLWLNRVQIFINAFFSLLFSLSLSRTKHVQQICLKPTKRSDLILADGTFYECPLYKTSQRHILVYGKRKTDNFITFIRLKCTDELPPNHWILRGCALICQLDDWKFAYMYTCTLYRLCFAVYSISGYALSLTKCIKYIEVYFKKHLATYLIIENKLLEYAKLTNMHDGKVNWSALERISLFKLVQGKPKWTLQSRDLAKSPFRIHIYNCTDTNIPFAFICTALFSSSCV